MKCAICDENEASLKITVVTMKDDLVHDWTEVCQQCASDPCGELCLILPKDE